MQYTFGTPSSFRPALEPEHLRMLDLRPLPSAQWEDAGTRGEGSGPRLGPLQALSADREALQKGRGGRRNRRVYWVE